MFVLFLHVTWFSTLFPYVTVGPVKDYLATLGLCLQNLVGLMFLSLLMSVVVFLQYSPCCVHLRVDVGVDSLCSYFKRTLQMDALNDKCRKKSRTKQGEVITQWL